LEVTITSKGWMLPWNKFSITLWNLVGLNNLHRPRLVSV
jgi:hypothetical protein